MRGNLPLIPRHLRRPHFPKLCGSVLDRLLRLKHNKEVSGAMPLQSNKLGRQPNPKMRHKMSNESADLGRQLDPKLC